MEILKYIVDDKTIAELLGVQNFTNKESAILELVKNSFDALSKTVEISFSDGDLFIRDYGIGMNRQDILEKWMHVGKSSKGYSLKSKDGFERVLAGSKGIGRFALARLGGIVEINTKKDNYPLTIWKTDWNNSGIEEKELKENFQGTLIHISDLRDSWTINSAKKLAEYLGKTYNSKQMQIIIRYNNTEMPVSWCFENPKLNINYTSLISLNFKSNKGILNCNIKSDEFLDEAKSYCSDLSISEYSTNINMSEELSKNEFDIEIESINNLLEELGDFNANFYFSLTRVSTDDYEKFLYKRKGLSAKYKEGIILYRNAFSISSFEGNKDWLGLGKRSRKSPAAATHPTGTWRVRENQLSGNVNIDKIKNVVLQDLSNRQGLEENKYYECFIKILLRGVEEFEQYRQSIIRKINKRNEDIVVNKNSIIKKIIEDPKLMNNLNENQKDELVIELKSFQNKDQGYKREIIETENRYKYDIRILNVLATSGLKATSIAHELKNYRNNIENNYNYIIEAMKKYNIWDYVNEEDRTNKAYLSIPRLLEDNNKINKKLIVFMDTMLKDNEKNKFFNKKLNISNSLSSIKEVWERDYSWIHIDFEGVHDDIYKLSEDILQVIFDNLILNSIQQNEKTGKLEIRISCDEINGQLQFVYKDNGNGLPSKYRDKPFRILEVHETSREDGHGLGMWIVNNTINMVNGEITHITGNQGFELKFYLGEYKDENN